MTKDKVIKKILENKSALNNLKIKSIYLFGSYVRNEQNKDSDIDLLVKFDDSRFDKNFNGYYDNYKEVLSFLHKLLRKKVDLITEDMLSPYLKSDIFKEIEPIEEK
jgi:uncharacterized protein